MWTSLSRSHRAGLKRHGNIADAVGLGAALDYVEQVAWKALLPTNTNC